MIWSLFHREPALRGFWFWLLLAGIIRLIVWGVEPEADALFGVESFEEVTARDLSSYRGLFCVFFLLLIAKTGSRFRISPFEATLPYRRGSLWAVRMTAILVAWLLPLLIAATPSQPFLPGNPFLPSLLHVLAVCTLMTAVACQADIEFQVKLEDHSALQIAYVMIIVIGLVLCLVEHLGLRIAIAAAIPYALFVGLRSLPRAPHLVELRPSVFRPEPTGKAARVSVMPEQPIQILPRLPDMQINTGGRIAPSPKRSAPKDLEWDPESDLARRFALRGLTRIITLWMGGGGSFGWLNALVVFGLGFWLPFTNPLVESAGTLFGAMMLVIVVMVAVMTLETLSALSPLPISRRHLFKLTMGPSLIAAVLGLALGGATVALTDSYPAPLRYGRNVLYVPQECWRIVEKGEVPVIEAPWGERVEPKTYAILPGVDRVAYNPFAADSGSTRAFRLWQEARAVAAIYGETAAPDFIELQARFANEDVPWRDIRGETFADLGHLSNPVTARAVPLLVLRYLLIFLAAVWLATRCLDPRHRFFRYRGRILSTMMMALYVFLYSKFVSNNIVAAVVGLEVQFSHLSRDFGAAAGIPPWGWWAVNLVVTALGLLWLGRIFERMDYLPVHSMLARMQKSNWRLRRSGE